MKTRTSLDTQREMNRLLLLSWAMAIMMVWPMLVACVLDLIDGLRHRRHPVGQRRV